MLGSARWLRVSDFRQADRECQRETGGRRRLKVPIRDLVIISWEFDNRTNTNVSKGGG
jgi:hypothetical protein